VRCRTERRWNTGWANRLPFSRSPFLSLLGYKAIVYQANPQRCDKISDPGVCQDLQFGLPRILQPGPRFLERRIRVPRVAYQLGRAVWQALHELCQALAPQLAGL